MHLCHHLKAFNIKTVRYDNETSTVSGGVMLKSASVSDTQRRKSGRYYYNTFYIKMKIKTLRYYMVFLYLLVEIMSMSHHMPPCLITLRVRFDEKTL